MIEDLTRAEYEAGSISSREARAPAHRPLLVGAREPPVASHIGGQDRRIQCFQRLFAPIW